MREIIRTIVPPALSILLLIEWGCVYFTGGVLNSLGSQGIYMGSIIGSALLVVMGMKFLHDLFKNEKLDSVCTVILIISAVMAYPNLVFR